ncbi:hypothetical protein [Paenibacillus sp. Leaf72]|uniref:hypothetical protein n=1 Tax=Paenibacillus sp. Leaf72 TaxID=1736234 RepID=UPI0006FECA3F|nr:hypothetical protein [Paenibacillus sp. Leaf72]KQN97587.1 hypothetical protein ASF12_20455 [Paenibacillus sp. Leaf72]
MIKWKLLDAFLEQDARHNEVVAGYQQRVSEAAGILTSNLAEMDKLMRREFETGEDMGSKKAELRTKIAASNAAKSDAESELRAAYDFFRQAKESNRISVRDLTLDWNGPYRTEVQQKELQPIIDRMAAARLEYYSAVLDVYKLKDSYAHAQEEIKEKVRLDDKSRPGDHIYVHEIIDMSSLPLIRDEELMDISTNRKLPEGNKQNGKGV